MWDLARMEINGRGKEGGIERRNKDGKLLGAVSSGGRAGA
jgi:hypothetical protein